MAAPPPLPPGGAAPAKKSNVLLWVLITIGGLFVLFIVGLMAAGLFVAHKVKEASVDGKGIVLSSPNGSFQIGGRAKVPAWVPDYPGSNPQSAFSARSDQGEGGTFTFKTKDSPEQVGKYYQDQFEASGMKLSTNNSFQGGSGNTRMLIAQDESNRHSVTVMITGRGNETPVTVTYATNK
ncbi:MAG TPA: hypothetical protein VMB25_00180 [Bryobacteraceae bacterium]|nr:hypothetical protein [Bryobacteraceae bacterium]